MKEIYKTASSSAETGGCHCAFSNPGHMRLKWQMAEIQLCWLCLDSGGGRYSRVQGVVRLEWEVLRKRFICTCWEAYFSNFTIPIYCFWGFLLNYSHFPNCEERHTQAQGGRERGTIKEIQTTGRCKFIWPKGLKRPGQRPGSMRAMC